MFAYEPLPPFYGVERCLYTSSYPRSKVDRIRTPTSRRFLVSFASDRAFHSLERGRDCKKWRGKDKREQRTDFFGTLLDFVVVAVHRVKKRDE